MPRYNFIFQRGSVVKQAETLALAYFMLDTEAQGQLVTVECGVAHDPDPEMTFTHYTEDLFLRVEADAQASSGDGWNEPREPSMVWTYRVWYNTQYDGTGQWVAMDLTALNPSVIDFLNDEASDRYLSSLDEDEDTDDN